VLIRGCATGELKAHFWVPGSKVWTPGTKGPQVSTSTQKYPQVLTRMIRHGIFLPLTHLDTNWCPFCKAQQRDWTCRRCAAGARKETCPALDILFMICFYSFCEFMWFYSSTSASISRLALWHCHTLKDVEELAPSNLRRSFNGWVQGGLGIELDNVSYRS
jgi:hypothetical protein